MISASDNKNNPQLSSLLLKYKGKQNGLKFYGRQTNFHLVLPDCIA